MLKYIETARTFSEFPTEIAICISITQCPCHCKGCSEPYLAEEKGEFLTEEQLQKILESNPHCTVFGLMGGDADHDDIKRISNYVKSHSKMKVGFYSGRDYIDPELIPYLDYYKIGSWIMPKGDSKDWYKTNCGPIQFPFSNQLFFEIKDGKMINRTDWFRKQPVGNFSRYIINDEEG